MAQKQNQKESAEPHNSDENTVETNLENRSALAGSIQRLKSATLAAAAKRQHLPQPLFWSLFHAELDQIKARKEQARLLQELFKA